MAEHEPDPMVDAEPINFDVATAAMAGLVFVDEPEWPSGTGPFGS